MEQNEALLQRLYQLYLSVFTIQTDTRKLQPGAIYWALKGPNFNGNAYAMKALELGASYAVVDDPALATLSDKVVVVPDTLAWLQALAKHHRQQLNIPIIAITGSNGKTTTKELVSAVLATIYTTYTTEGNLNNHIGVPLTLLKIKADAQIAVVEMGANHQKEIAGYCSYTLPNYGLITNCGKAHLEGFGGVEGVKKGKGELYDFIRENGGTAFVNWDYDYLQTMSKGINNLIKYGTTEGDLRGEIISNSPFLEISIAHKPILASIRTQLVGDYNLPNVLSAVAIGRHFKVPDPLIKHAIEQYSPSNSRSQLLQIGSNQIILDAYNANPTSMKAAIENFAQLDSTKNKILLLGGMMELGEDSLLEHEAIILLIAKHQWKQVVLVGGDFGNVSHPFLYFNNSIEAKEWYVAQNFSNTLLLVKGSRSMQMEKIIQ